MTTEEMVKKLREDGHTVWSFSRLGSFHNCNFEYYNTYIKKNRGIGNCYTELGSMCHQYVEGVYKGEIADTSDFNQKLHTKLMELEIMGLDFPSETIKNSFVKDVDHFTKNFNKLDGRFDIEKMFLANIKGNYILGYIDAIRTLESEEGKKEVSVVDWKSSSKFTGDKLKSAGRQLVIYKLGLEQTSDLNIDKVMWGMLKYINVCWVQANKKVKKKMVNRGKLIKEMKKTFEKDMLKAGMDEIEVSMILMSAEQSNSFDTLPQLIKDKYWLEDCFVEYEVTDEVVQEVEDYVVNTIKEIESKDTTNESEWKPVDFDKEGTFYCNTLCSHRLSCPFIKQYKKDNPFSKGY